jgi:glyoxylase-like metal-dependent hydrolase (beta-lactamase superfamily II)
MSVPTGDPAYDALRQVTATAGVVLANNPTNLTLEGTNTWLLRSEPSRREAIVVDPGPLDDAHLDAVVAAAGTVPLILLTHGHSDHSDGAKKLHERTGAAVLALDPKHQYGGQGLSEGAVLDAAGVTVRVWSTPGHTSDSLCFLLEGDSAVLTGDTILGRGTTMVAYPDGVLRDYLHSLHRLAELDGLTVLPGHGPDLADAGAVATYYLAHRQQRLDQVRAVVAELGPDVTDDDVLSRVYADVDKALWPAAKLSVNAQLVYLRDETR